MVFLFATEYERDKFEFIYGKYKKLLLHKAYDILKDYMLAEDAVSEAFIRIYKNLHKIDDPTSNSSVAFLVTIVKNTSLTLLSKQTKGTAELYEDTQEDGFSLEQHILSEIGAENIYVLMNTISEELRSVFLLKFAYDMSHKEIGSLLQISENNVTVRLHRAKKKLSEILIKEGYVHG